MINSISVKHYHARYTQPPCCSMDTGKGSAFSPSAMVCKRLHLFPLTNSWYRNKQLYSITIFGSEIIVLCIINKQTGPQVFQLLYSNLYTKDLKGYPRVIKPRSLLSVCPVVYNLSSLNLFAKSCLKTELPLNYLGSHSSPFSDVLKLLTFFNVNLVRAVYTTLLCQHWLLP